MTIPSSSAAWVEAASERRRQAGVIAEQHAQPIALLEHQLGVRVRVEARREGRAGRPEV